MLGQFAWLIKFGEDDLSVIRAYTHAGIADDDLDAAFGQIIQARVHYTACNGDLSVVGRELDRVVDQMLKDLPQAVRVAFDIWKNGQVNGRRKISIFGLALERQAHIAQNIAQSDLLQIQLH